MCCLAVAAMACGVVGSDGSPARVGSTNSAMTATLGNILPTSLTVSGFAFTDADPGDFVVSLKTCGSFPAKSSCAIDLMFSATQTGARLAALNINDNANNSPQTVSLTDAGT